MSGIQHVFRLRATGTSAVSGSALPAPSRAFACSRPLAGLQAPANGPCSQMSSCYCPNSSSSSLQYWQQPFLSLLDQEHLRLVSTILIATCRHLPEVCQFETIDRPGLAFTIIMSCQTHNRRSKENAKGLSSPWKAPFSPPLGNYNLINLLSLRRPGEPIHQATQPAVPTFGQIPSSTF